MSQTSKLCSTAAMVALVFAGAPTWVGAQQNKSTMEEVKTTVSDSWITGKTKIALYADSRVSGTQINVDTMSGMVHLRGKVDSAAAKAAAEDVARGIEGVRGVKNELQVVPSSVKNVVEAKDDEITKKVEARFEADPKLKSLDVRTDNGVVTIEGKLPSITDSARASQLAREVAGVRAVRNDTTYEHPRTSMDGDRPRARVERVASQDKSMNDAHATHAMNGNARVRAAQEALEEKGYDPGPIDGIWGPRTAAAVSEYQRQENMTVSGRLDDPTMTQLELGPDGKPIKKRQSP